jgi:hypothetical protein
MTDSHDAKAVLGTKPKHSSKSKGKKVHEMHIRKADSGGYIAKHDMEQPEDPSQEGNPSEEHVLPDVQSLAQHVQDHMSPEPPEAAPSPEDAGAGA